MSIAFYVRRIVPVVALLLIFIGSPGPVLNAHNPPTALIRSSHAHIPYVLADNPNLVSGHH